MLKIYRFIQALTLTAVGTLTASAADGSFVIEPDNASHIIVQTGNPKTDVPAVDGKFNVSYTNWVDVIITPADGFIIESIVGYNHSGTPVNQENGGWKYNSSDYSYSIYSTSSNPHNGFRYVVTTRPYIRPSWNISVTINNVKALAGGIFKAGKETITAENGENKFTINPDNGKAFSMDLTRSVKSATLTFNGNVQVPDTSYDGHLQYKFDLTDNSTITLEATLENPVCHIDVNDPSKVLAYYPDADTRYDFKAGRNDFTYEVGKTLTLYAAEGYKLECSDNFEYNSSTKAYSIYFRGGESGVVYTVNTVEYTAPIANINLNVDDPALLTCVFFRPGFNIVRQFNAGDNLYSHNTEDISSMEIDYSVENSEEIIAACNDRILEITTDIYGDLISEINDLKAGDYFIAVRRRLAGDYAGQTTITSDSTHAVWTLSFNPGGVLEIADENASIDMIKDNMTIASAQVVMKNGTASLTFPVRNLVPGDYTVSVPAGMFRVNGASLPRQTSEFTIEQNNDGVNSVFIDGTLVDVYSIDGRIVIRQADADALRHLAPGLYIAGGRKFIVK